MSLSERLASAKKPLKSKFETWIDTLDKADQEALLEAACDPQLSNAAIVSAIREEGHAVNKDTVSSWRKANGYVPR